MYNHELFLFSVIQSGVSHFLFFFFSSFLLFFFSSVIKNDVAVPVYVPLMVVRFRM